MLKQIIWLTLEQRMGGPFRQQIDPVACIDPQHIPHESESFLLRLGQFVAPPTCKYTPLL